MAVLEDSLCRPQTTGQIPQEAHTDIMAGLNSLISGL